MFQIGGGTTTVQMGSPPRPAPAARSSLTGLARGSVSKWVRGEAAAARTGGSLSLAWRLAGRHRRCRCGRGEL